MLEDLEKQDVLLFDFKKEIYASFRNQSIDAIGGSSEFDG